MSLVNCFRTLGVVLLIFCFVACTSRFQLSQLNSPQTYAIAAYQPLAERPSLVEFGGV